MKIDWIKNTRAYLNESKPKNPNEIIEKNAFDNGRYENRIELIIPSNEKQMNVNIHETRNHGCHCVRSATAAVHRF